MEMNDIYGWWARLVVVCWSFGPQKPEAESVGRTYHAVAINPVNVHITKKTTPGYRLSCQILWGRGCGLMTRLAR